MYNPYQQYQNNFAYSNPYNRPEINNQYSNNKLEIVKVNGENGARAYQMPPNSSILLLDETAPIIWLKTTDGASYPTLTPYNITPYKPDPPIDVNNLENRIKRLEDIIQGSGVNAESNNASTKSKRRTSE